MSQAQKIHLYSVDEYFALERTTAIRHEYLNGEIVAMGGASRFHNMLAFNLGTAIRPHLRGTSCRIGGSDMNVFIAKVNRGYYPDLVVSCNDFRHEHNDYTETEPCLIIEVLSPSTAAIDRKQKRIDYQMLDSLQDYVLVAQTEPLVEVYSRASDGGWTQTIYGADETVNLPSIDLQLEIAVIYEDIIFE